MTFSFTADIDESGDNGFVFKPKEQRCSWLVLPVLVASLANLSLDILCTSPTEGAA
jgi:hypothetical protein